MLFSKLQILHFMRLLWKIYLNSRHKQPSSPKYLWQHNQPSKPKYITDSLKPFNIKQAINAWTMMYGIGWNKGILYISTINGSLYSNNKIKPMETRQGNLFDDSVWGHTATEYWLKWSNEIYRYLSTLAINILVYSSQSSKK